MESHIDQVIHQCARDSYAGTIGFGDVVGALMKVGVQSYHADFRVPATTYYLPGDATRTLALHAPDVEIARDFDARALLSAIRGAQRGEVKYPEFLKLSMAAGCVGYFVWIEGRHVSYFGRRGEVHIEHFPTSS
jgi:uncharacterized protein YbcV (DUF1398 family)